MLRRERGYGEPRGRRLLPGKLTARGGGPDRGHRLVGSSLRGTQEHAGVRSGGGQDKSGASFAALCGRILVEKHGLDRARTCQPRDRRCWRSAHNRIAGQGFSRQHPACCAPGCARGGVGANSKIEGDGTPGGVEPGPRVGWRGTRPEGVGAVRCGNGRKEKRLGRASPDRLRWSWTGERRCYCRAAETAPPWGAAGPLPLVVRCWRAVKGG